ncbi:otogelin [Clarias gariepinus]
MFPCLNGDQCLYPDFCNCSFYQATGSHCQTVPNTGLEREMACRSWGQYNYETFDGLYYYFPGKCSYTLLKDCEDNTKPSVFIQVHNDPECHSNPYSCRRSVSLFLPWEGEIRLQGFNVTFKGQSLQLPHNLHDIELERISDYILVSQHQVFMLAWQGVSSSIYIKMSPEFVGRTCGLCGNFNADVQDDLKTSYGVLTENLAMFGNSWMEEDPQLTCQMVPSPFLFPCSVQEAYNLLKVEKVCTSLLKVPFKSCHEFVNPYSYIASCSNDLCLSGSSGDIVCQVFTEYTRACAHAGHPLHNWRSHFPLCGIECPADLLYRECITCCPVHCNFEHICIDSKLQCLDGCYCPDGLIYEDGICVKPSECPCEHRGMLYPSGHSIQEECNNCTCAGGVWNCTEHSCPGECSVTGDMYFQSFDGRVYTFPATCQYVLAKSRSPGRFIVTIHNTPCGPNLDGACIQSVNLVLNEDPRTEIMLSHNGEVYMASQIRISLPYSDEMFQIQELSSMFVQVKTVHGLRLQYNWKEFQLYLQLGELWRDDTVGLCGTFNGNIQDDFLAPSGMIESSPNLFGNAWRLSSACMPRPSLPQLDPCDIHQQAASYAVEKCDVLMQEIFAVCHEHVSPMAFLLQCRADVCRCGVACLCSALAHYTRTCRKHNIIIEFRSRVPECGVTCPPTMEYGVCVSSCERHCLSLSLPQICGDECEEGCVCPLGTYYSMRTQTCVKRSECPCSFLGADYSPGDVILTSSDIQICQDGKLVSQSIITDKLCPPGQVYEDCGNMVEGLSASKGLACVHTCESYLLNMTCSSHEPCVPGCICPPGLLKHGDECFEPVACPCLWKGKEYYPGDRVSSPCHQCVCQHGSFQCDFYPCASMCTAYGDRHYRTFDGLLFDYIGGCKVYLLKTSGDVSISVTAENVDCFESGSICRKSPLISIGKSVIVFDNESGKPNPSSIIDRQSVYILNAGYFTIIHLTQYEISVLWDRKTTIHIQAGPRWQGKLSGLCGNFDLKTVNEMKTPDNMDLSTPQEFGNSWTATECIESPDIRHPCILNPIREPFAKRQCGILLSEVFQACHPVVDVTWYYMNCLMDTCSCSRGGDCECFCTSLATYAHRCCQHGISIDWRSPSLCPYDCEYYNKVLGKGPFRLLTYKEKNLLLAANRTSGFVSLRRRVSSTDGVVTLFMMTPGLSKTRPHDSSLVSFEAADRPNYFLHAERSGYLRLRKWENSREFCDAATFILHRDTWITGFDSLESLKWPGFFLYYILYKLQLLKYNHSAHYRRATLFKLAGSSTGDSIIPQCQWRYESCTSPCFRTCSDPNALSCVTTLKVEGCLPQCPAHMVMDEMTQRCVYLEDCNMAPVKLPELNLTPTAVTSSTLATVTLFTASEALNISQTKTSPLKPRSTASTTPPYSVVVDECTKLICVNGQLVLFNKSQSCPYDSSPPNCGLLGFAVLVNGDKCCPKWNCPCRCSVFPDINVVTFDGNNVALYKAAAYVVTQLMNETITIFVQECNSSDSTLVWNFTHLCLAILNITHDSNQVLINRLQRQVYVNSRYVKPRLKKYGFKVLDTGNMYLIWTPAGLKIQWFHSTGMMVIETETNDNKVSTMGLCGCCDGNSLNDLILPNGTVVDDHEDPAVFIDSWQIPNTTIYVSQSRRRKVNCSTSDCSDCLNMLNNLTFTACHSYVPPAVFCEIWVRDAEYVNNPCVALAAYVASCHKFNICIEWRSPEYCPFVCPGTLQYQACLPACTAPSCPNKEMEYDAVQCSGISEGCICSEGTLLHRPYSALCVSPVMCACTDSFGSPRALGEIWKASVNGCCMYRCESDGIVPVEFECSDIPQPVCTRAGEISISLTDDNSCCIQRVCDCKIGQRMVSYFRNDSCCPEYTCECDPDQCVLDVPVCREDQTLIATRTEGSCCLAHICMCDICSEPIPECTDGEMLTVDTNSTDRCCPIYHCLCEPSRCSVIACPVGMVAVSTMVPGQCCPSQECKCACERIPQPNCALGEKLKLDRAFMADPENHCGCKRYQCERSAVCVDGKRGVMRPGQTLMEHSALGVCYTTRCTQKFNSATGFYVIEATSINCTAQCQPNQVYMPPKDQSACCGVCKNVSCIYHSDNGSLALYKPGRSWVSSCMRYDCTETESGSVLVSYSYSCPPFNETECMKIGGTVMTYMDGCCKTCTGHSIFPFPVNTLKPTISTKCDRGKEDGKSCQKVTVRMTIRKNDCRSNRPVNIVSCDGKCPSASIYNYNINTYARFCKCCRELGLQRRSVQLYCSGNATWVNYSIQEPTDCSCQWS